jgi:3-hydroxyisobutyrate dehydrogenase-like beta-hydroxyacid dehydrogenase
VRTDELRFDILGVNALHGERLSASHAEPYEVRVRVAGRTADLKEAMRIANEVESLYTCGPAGGGGATKSARDIVAVLSVLLPREQVHASVHCGES